MTQPKPSKSARKREQQALRELGDQLIGWSRAEIDRLPLDETLRTAIVEAASIKSHGALRRQKQLVAKLMRDIDTGPIQAAIVRKTAKERAEKRVFAQAEQWRDRVVRDGQAAIDAFERKTGLSGSQLVDLNRELSQVLSDAQEKALKRKLFRRIHDALMTSSQDDRLPQ